MPNVGINEGLQDIQAVTANAIEEIPGSVHSAHAMIFQILNDNEAESAESSSMDNNNVQITEGATVLQDIAGIYFFFFGGALF